MPPIYHITHLRNLPSILESGCLWCDKERFLRKLNTTGIAHEHIKQRRARRRVPTAARGTLDNYVPFYFAPRSPMLYTIHKGNVVNYNDGQSPVLHLVSSVERVVESELPFTFTDGHAEMATCTFFERIEDLNNVDWQIMQSRLWNDTPQDGNRKWRRQAEFLVHNHFPLNLISEIGVISPEFAEETARLADASGYKIEVNVRKNWYY
jgi:hypothetical protein